MAGVYDADSHIAEPEAMWQKLDPEFHPRRPVIVSVPPSGSKSRIENGLSSE